MNIDRVGMIAGGDGGGAANAGVIGANAGLAGIFAELLAAITEAGIGINKDAVGEDASASAHAAMAGAFPLPLPLVVPAPTPESEEGTDLRQADETKIDAPATCSGGAGSAMPKVLIEAASVTGKPGDAGRGPAVGAVPVETNRAPISQMMNLAAPPAQPSRVEAAPSTATTPAGVPAPRNAATQAAAAPLTVSFAPKVDLQAPKAAAGSAVPARESERGQSITAKSAAGAKSTSSGAPTVTVERARASSDAATEVKPPRMPGPLVHDVPVENSDQSAPAPVELVAAAPTQSAAHSPAAHTPEKPLPATPAVPLHPAMQQLVHRVEKAVERGEDTITIELKPASLGHVEVQLRVAEDGRVAAAVTADRGDTLSILQQDSARLEQALRDAGLRADAGSLSFSLREGNGQGDAHQRHGRGNRRNNNGGTFAIEAPTNGGERSRAHVGALDLRI